MKRSTQCGKMKNLLPPKNISSNQLFSKFFSKNVAFTKFLPKKCESKFPFLPHCVMAAQCAQCGNYVNSLMNFW